MISRRTGARFRLSGAGLVLGGVRVLQGVDLAIEPGEAVALVGPSGAGKTSLLGLLNASRRATEGVVELNGVDLAGLGQRALRRARATVGFVHQDFALVPNVRVAQNVLFGKLGGRGFLQGLRSMVAPREDDLVRAHGILERLGIADKLYQRTDTLSGGEEQRVALGRALFQDPVALLADEPVASVDPARARDLVALMQELAREDGLTLVVSLHDLEIAREFFPRLIGLRGGRVALDRSMGEVREEEFAELYRLGEAEATRAEEPRP